MGKLLITGAHGFVASRLLDALKMKGVSNDRIILLTSKPIHGYTCVDYSSQKLLSSALDGNDLDCVVHLGAFTPKGICDDRIVNYIKNIESTSFLIEALAQPPKKFIFSSSISVYAPSNGEMITEDSLVGTDDPYGMSKLFCEKMLKEWASAFNVDLCILRLGAVYGPGEENYRKITGTFIERALNGEPIMIRSSNGSERRNLVYIDDVVECIVESMLNKDTDINGIVNIVGDCEISVNNLAEMIIDISRSSSIIVYEGGMPSRDDCFASCRMNELYGDVVKRTGYDEGVRKLVQYYKTKGHNK